MQDKRTLRRYAVDHSQAIHDRKMKFTTQSTKFLQDGAIGQKSRCLHFPCRRRLKRLIMISESGKSKTASQKTRNQGSGSYGRGRVQLDSIHDSCRHDHLVATTPSCLKDSAILSPCSPLDPEHTQRQREAKEKQVMIGRKEDGRLVSLGVSFANNSPPL
jgi:hypothetical protein